ncbi:MAG: hypothetical protein ACTSRA_08335 [Promethearchaeota archaeon]
MLILKIEDNHIIRGVNYAVKTWPVTFNRMGKGPIDRIINIMKGITVEYAFIDYLEKNNIEHDLEGQTAWYKIDRYDIGVKGKEIDIKTNYLDPFLPVLQARGIDQLNPNNTEWLLDCCALVPSDQLYSRTFPDNGYYIFAYLTGHFNPEVQVKKKFAHAFWEYEWFKPARWIKEHGKPQLGRIQISSDSRADKNEKFIVIGTKDYRQFYSETLQLDSNAEAETAEEFFQVFTLISEGGDLPTGTISVKGTNTTLVEDISPQIGFVSHRDEKKNMIVEQNDWGNIWIYDSYVYFAGCMTKGDFKEKSESIPRFYKKCKQYADILVKNNMIQVQDLDDMDKIFG